MRHVTSARFLARIITARNARNLPQTRFEVALFACLRAVEAGSFLVIAAFYIGLGTVFDCVVNLVGDSLAPILLQTNRVDDEILSALP